MQGKLIIFSAPSGSGKTTIVKHLLQRGLNLEFSVSACSRKQRAGETYGKDYYFLSIEEFKKKIKKEEFVEWEEVYEDNYYGTLRSEIERIWAKGKHVVFDVDVMGGLNLKRQYKELALAIFVKAPSIKHIEERLKRRDTESPESFSRRIQKAAVEMETADNFDVILVNDQLEKALDEAEILVRDFISKEIGVIKPL
jgi:guanylate kinase